MCSLKEIGCLACEHCSPGDRVCTYDPQNPRPITLVEKTGALK